MVARIEWEVRKRMKEEGEIENGERKKMLKRIYVLAIGIVLFSVFVMPVTATGEMTATRDISIQVVKPGDTFTVTVTIVANEDVEAPALDEDLPEGWEVTSVENDGGIFKESTVEWIWTEKLSAGDSKTVIYNVTVPLDAETGTYYIKGHVSAYGVNPIAVGGESEVVVAPPENYTVIFEENFENLSKWYLVVYNSAGGSENDPAPTLDTTMGLPAPSLDVNGDSWCGNGAYTKETFDYTNGLVIEFDMYVASGYDWNWGWCGLSDHMPNLNNPRPDGAYVDPLRCDPSFVAGIHFTDDGSYNWNPPSLRFVIKTEDGMGDGYTYARDASEFQNKWNHYKIYIRPDGYVEFYMNGSLIWVSTKKIDKSYSPMPLLLGSRDAYGPVRVDNVIVRAPIQVPASTVSFNPPEIKIPLGSTSAINLTLDAAPRGLSGYNISISLSDGGVAEITSVEFPDWAGLHSNSTLPADSLWIKAADLKDEIKSGAKNITLAKITLRGDKQGESNILITVTKMDDDDGNPIDPNTISGKVEVIGVIPFPGCENPPKDPDRDGLYEDINGNCRKDFNDVVLFFKYLEWVPENQPCVKCFDFNRNCRIDFDDVVELFEEI